MPYLWGFLFFIFLLGFPFFVLVIANKQDGWLKLAGWILSGVFVLILIISSLFSLISNRFMCEGFRGHGKHGDMHEHRFHPGFGREEIFKPNLDEEQFIRDWLKDPENRRIIREMIPELREHFNRDDIRDFPVFPHPGFKEPGDKIPPHEPPFEGEPFPKPPHEGEPPFPEPPPIDR